MTKPPKYEVGQLLIYDPRGEDAGRPWKNLIHYRLGIIIAVKQCGYGEWEYESMWTGMSTKNEGFIDTITHPENLFATWVNTYNKWKDYLTK